MTIKMCFTVKFYYKNVVIFQCKSSFGISTIMRYVMNFPSKSYLEQTQLKLFQKGESILSFIQNIKCQTMILVCIQQCILLSIL